MAEDMAPDKEIIDEDELEQVVGGAIEHYSIDITGGGYFHNIAVLHAITGIEGVLGAHINYTRQVISINFADGVNPEDLMESISKSLAEVDPNAHIYFE